MFLKQSTLSQYWLLEFGRLVSGIRMQSKISHLKCYRYHSINMRQYNVKSHFLRVLTLTLLGLGLGLYAWPVYCLNNAHVALKQGLIIQAENWCQSGQSIPLFTDQFLEVKLRAHRQLGRSQSFYATLKKAHAAELEAEFLELEQILFNAQSGKLSELEAALPQLLEQGEDLPAICEAYALGCLQQFRLQEARQILQKWQADYPGSPQSHYLMARIDEYQRSLETAVTELNTALRICPDYAPAWYALGRIQHSKQEYDLAFESYRSASDKLFNPQPALVAMARCKRELGEYDSAQAFLDQANQCSETHLEEAYRYVGERTENYQAQLTREYAVLCQAQNRDDDSLQWFQQTLAVDPKDWKTRFQYAQALRRCKKPEQAQQELEQAEQSRLAFEEGDRLIDLVMKDPTDVESRYQLGKILLAHFSENQGLVWLNSVLKYDPDHHNTHQELARYFRDHLNEHPAYPALAKHHQQMAQKSGTQSTGTE